MDLKDLSAQMRCCSLCADLPLGPRPLFQLHSEVRILIAGQAPGRKTHRVGRPFDDASGDRLRGWMGIDRDDFYDNPKIGVLPMGLCYPGTGSQGDLPPRVECAVAWHGKVLPLLAKLDLMLVIGRYAIDWHLPALKGARVTDAVQSWESCLPSTLVLPHPSPRNNRWLSQNPWFNETVVPQLKNRVAQIMG